MPNFAHQPAALAIDAFVLLIYFTAIVGIGLWAGRKNRSLTEFALGGRSIPWWAVLASIIAAETSAATFLGAPTEGFETRSYIYAQLTLGTVLARILIAFTFIRPYYRYGVQSIYEFLELRFGPWTRNLASGIFLFTRVLGIGVRLYLGGVILKVIWQYLYPGATADLSIYFWGILLVTVITTAYTAVGGIKAVVWTDMIQALLMFGSVIFAIFLLLNQIPGGLTSAREVLGGVPPFFQLGIDWSKDWWGALQGMLLQPYTIASALVASTFQTMATHGTDQDMVQRMLTAEDYRKSRLSLILSGLVDLPIALSFLSVGILLYVHYRLSPDPQLPAAANEVFAHYILTQIPVGFRGLIIAGVFATMMGSTSAALNALATSFTKDFYLPYFARKGGPDRAVVAARLSTIFFGIFLVLVATAAAQIVLLHPDLTIIPIVLGTTSYTYGALLGVFLLGMLTKSRGKDQANLFAMLIAVAAVVVLGDIKVPGIDLSQLVSAGRWVPQEWSTGGWLPRFVPRFSWPWLVFVGCLTCLAISALFKTPGEAQQRALSRRAEGAEAETNV